MPKPPGLPSCRRRGDHRQSPTGGQNPCNFLCHTRPFMSPGLLITWLEYISRGTLEDVVAGAIQDRVVNLGSGNCGEDRSTPNVGPRSASACERP